MYKEWKEITGIISNQMQNISRDRSYILKVVGKVGGSQIEILRLKSTVTEQKFIGRVKHRIWEGRKESANLKINQLRSV